MDNVDLETALKDWSDLSSEYVELQAMHKNYTSKLEELIKIQKKCISGNHHQKYRLNAIKKMVKDSKGHMNEEQAQVIHDLDKDILRRQAQLTQMEDCLPKPSGTYLKIILGDINVSILDKKAKYDYKDQYERFKLIVNLIGCVVAILSLCFNHHLLDLVFMFLTVWYYCTLTIRESILKVNGSRIKGWWRTHHFISTFAGGVLLIWPDGYCYQSFRDQMMLFNVYVVFVQYLQFTYQKGVLYRLRSLGERLDMDITIDGFHSWMWKGLGFLLPFLYVGYIFQLYNAYTLFHLCFHKEATWQVPCLFLVFAILGTGNIITVSWTIPAKIIESRKGLLKMRFTRLDKYIWRHKRRSESLCQTGSANAELENESTSSADENEDDTKVVNKKIK